MDLYGVDLQPSAYRQTDAIGDLTATASGNVAIRMFREVDDHFEQSGYAVLTVEECVLLREDLKRVAAAAATMGVPLDPGPFSAAD